MDSDLYIYLHILHILASYPLYNMRMRSIPYEDKKKAICTFPTPVLIYVPSQHSLTLSHNFFPKLPRTNNSICLLPIIYPRPHPVKRQFILERLIQPRNPGIQYPRRHTIRREVLVSVDTVYLRIDLQVASGLARGTSSGSVGASTVRKG